MNEKSQIVRLLDIFVIAPFLIYAAKKGSLNNLDKSALVILGVLTATYNYKNYVKNRVL